MPRASVENFADRPHYHRNALKAFAAVRSALDAANEQGKEEASHEPSLSHSARLFVALGPRIRVGANPWSCGDPGRDSEALDLRRQHEAAGTTATTGSAVSAAATIPSGRPTDGARWRSSWN